MMGPEDFLFEQIRIYEEIRRRRKIKIYLTIGITFVMMGAAYLYWS